MLEDEESLRSSQTMAVILITTGEHPVSTEGPLLYAHTTHSLFLKVHDFFTHHNKIAESTCEMSEMPHNI